MLLRTSPVLLLSILASCGGADGPIRPDPPEGKTPSVRSVDPLTPGEVGVLRGSQLEGVTRVSVDGHDAVITQASSVELRFLLPVLRVCETDGRGVEVLVNGSIRAAATIAAPNLVRLDPGESRVLGAAELACLSVGAGTSAYVLSAHNFSREPVAESFFRLRSHTTQPDTAASPFPSLQFGAARGFEREQHRVSGGRLGAGESAGSVTPFDPRYSSAAPGDTLTFVDWSRTQALTATSRDAVPVYRAAVLAVAGAQVVVLDLRTPGAGELVASPQVRERFRRAAEIADRLVLPAVRAVIDPEAAFPAGGGGRVFTIVRELPTGIAGGISTADLLDRGHSPWVSNIGIVDLSARFARESMRPEEIATTLIHEHGHLADVLAARRRGVAGAAGWFSEAIAVCVEERAARIAVGQEQQVTMAQVQTDGVPTAAMRMPDGMSEVYSPWGPFGSGRGATTTGAYVRGARLALYAMEQLGEIGLTPSPTSLYQRLLARSAPPASLSAGERERIWGIDAIAREVGLSPEALMEQASLAEISDDLVELQAAAARGLPQFRTWSNGLPSRPALSQHAFPTHYLPLDAARAGDVSVPGGAHHYWYVITAPGQGLSVSATRITLQPHHRVRITRLW